MKRTLVLLLASLMASACSKVDFTPTDEDAVGQSNGMQKETFNINQDDSTGAVDILFVVDNSSSMMAEQTKLGDRLDAFIGQLPNVDWQIGITTTDTSDGAYGLKGALLPLTGASGKILTKNTPNANTVFKNTIQRPETSNCQVCPTIDEQPLKAATLALQKRSGVNAGFFRRNVDTAVVILSDEDEMSNGPAGSTTAQSVIDAYKKAFGNNHHLTGFGIIVQPGDNDCYLANYATGGTFGTHAAELATLTGGLTGSICDDNYSDSLANIGRRVKEIIQSVTLKNDPDPETLDVRFTPDIPDMRWSVEGRKLRFSKAPKSGTKVEVRYYLPKKENEAIADSGN